MPLYSFRCDSCAVEVEDFAPIGGPFPSCNCGGKLLKLITMPQVVIPDYMRAVNHAEGGQHSQWFNSEATQARLKSGELEIKKKGDI